MGKESKGKEKGTPTPVGDLRRKIPRGHTPKKVGQSEYEYNEDGNGMDMDEGSQGLDVASRMELDGNPKKKRRNYRPEVILLESHKEMEKVLEPSTLASPNKKP